MSGPGERDGDVAGPGPLVPPGWYPDPEHPSEQRFWDGTAWTRHSSRQPATPPPYLPAGSPEPPDPATQAGAVSPAVAAPSVPAPPPSARPAAAPDRPTDPAPRAPWGAPPPSTPVVQRPAASDRPYAAAADRAGAFLSDLICVYLAWFVVAVVWSLVALVYSFLAVAVACPGGEGSCGSGGGSLALSIGALFLLVALVFSLVWVWWRLVPGRMALRGGSIGMAFGGLEIEDANRPVGIGRLTAFGRTVLPWLVAVAVGGVVWFGAVAAFVTDRFDPGVVFYGATVLGAVLVLLPRAWLLWDRRRQTLYDKAFGTVVVGPQGGSDPFGLAAIVMAYACWLLPVASLVLALPTVVCAHVARWRVGRPARARGGRGAAAAALWTGYLAIIGWVAVAALLWSSTGVPDLDRLVRDGRSALALPGSDSDASSDPGVGMDDADRRVCKYQLRFLEVAVERYRRDVGGGTRYPLSQADLLGRYLEFPLEEYDFTSDGATIEYRATELDDGRRCPAPS